MKLGAIVKHLWRQRKRPDPIRRTCYACHQVIEGQVFTVEGKPYCSYFDIPAVIRARRADVRP